MPKKTSATGKTADDHIAWYGEHRPQYEGLGRTVEGLLRELLTFRMIDFLAIVSRAKTVASFTAKNEQKHYANPRSEVTDLCGVRVITYLEADVLRVAEVIRETFEIDTSRSLDKSEALSVDRVGYRSLHFICKLGADRARLPEYAPLCGLTFEIQVRTVLQHAWAQIEHDRNYKFGGVLPAPLQRRLFLAAGLLETADREFDEIAAEIESYSRTVTQKTSEGELDLELTSQSLLAYLLGRTIDLPVIRTLETDTSAQQTVISELRAFGTDTIRDLDGLFSSEFVTFIKKHTSPARNNEIGLLREAMMYSDITRYFDVAWQQHWNGLPGEWLTALKMKYPKIEEEIVDKYGLVITPVRAERDVKTTDSKSKS